MSEINRMPDEQPALLSDPLRRVVEHIRSQPAPQGSMERALDRASAIHVAPPRRWFHLHPEIQVRIAVAAAILVAVGIGFWTNQSASRYQTVGRSQARFLADGGTNPTDDIVTVLVARRNVQQWTPIVDPKELFTKEKVARKDAPTDFIAGFEEARDRVITKSLPQGTILAMNSVQDKSKVGLEGMLTTKTRGIAVPITAYSATLAGGFIQPGSHIDLVQANGPNAGARIVLENIKVRAIDQQSVRPGDQQGGLSSTITLEVTPQQATKLAQMQGQGKLVPLLRPWGDNTTTSSLDHAPGLSKPWKSRAAGMNAVFADGSVHNLRYGIDPEVFNALGTGGDVASLEGGSSGGGWGFRPGPLQSPELGPLNNGSLQPGFLFGFPPEPFGMISSHASSKSGGFGGAGGNSGANFGGGGFGGTRGGDFLPPDPIFPLPQFHEHPENGGFYAAGSFLLLPKINRLRLSNQPTGDGTSVNLRKALQQTVIDSYSNSATSQETVKADKQRIDKTVDLAGKWAKLPEAERNKALMDLTSNAPARYKEVVTSYFSNLSLSEAQKQPQVWHRDSQRPTFARVYLGGGNSLDLVSLQVSVTVEGPRARTVVDHIFHNPHDRQLEGTFEYPLPTGASVSYFGMFQGQTRPNAPPRFVQGGQKHPVLTQPGSPTAQPSSLTALARLNPSDMAHQVSAADWGALQEARVVSKQKALETYEDIVRTRIDPALLEYSGGNTFTGRVFPIQPKGYNRVLIAYEELLPVIGDQVAYRFSLPNRKLSEMQITLQANQADFTEAVFFPKEAKKETGGGRVVYSHTWKDTNPVADATRLAGEVVFAGLPSRAQLQAISGRQGDSGPTYLYARVRPQLKVETSRPFADHAVFLLDTSLSEHPDRFGVSMKLWQQILQSDPGIKKFNILAFNVGASWIESKGWLDNTPEGRAKALSRLDGIVLEGATDLSAALGQLTRGADATPLAGLTKHTPLEVFLLSDGQVTWGNRDTNSLVAHFEAGCPYAARFHCYTIGLGAENIELFQALTRRGGGIYPCYSEAYLPAVARAHRSHCLLVERVSFKGGPAMSDVLVAGRQAAVYPGGDLVVAARAALPSPAAAAGGLPRTKLIVEGTFLGERVVYEYPIEITASSDLAARGWGELAVSSLLALNDPKLDSLVTAYCQQFGIGSRVASFLVLENPVDYKRLNLEEERGKIVPGGDLEKFLDDAWRNLARVIKPKQAFEEFLNKMASRISAQGPTNEEHVRKLFALLTDKDFELPDGVTGEALIRKKDVSPAYLAARQADPMNVHVYLDEAKRRANDKDAHGAIRVLSSVVEAYPTRADALRLVGYRLLDMHQSVQAVRLFQQVEESRPFEPHSYRDLARSLEESGRYGFAALQYEIVLAGAWHNRFRDSLKEVAREEYAHLMQEALAKARNLKSEIRISKELVDYFGERLEGMAGIRQQADLRVTISWNTDNTDVDLWVMEPDGTKCFYQNQKTSSGGQLSQDQTQGYGPERYQVQKALPGVYTVIVHYYRADANLLAGETHVNVLVTKHAGTPEETVQRHTILLKQANEQTEVCKVQIK